MANPKDNRNAETSKSMGADIGHMFMMGTYYPRDVMMRDANDGTVVHGSDHPTAGGETKQVQVGVANAVTPPVSQIYQACASDAAWQRTAGVSLDGLFVPFSATFKINSDKGSGHDANRSPGDAEYFPTFERPYSTMRDDGTVMNAVDDWWHAGTSSFGRKAGNFGHITSASLNPYASGHAIAGVMKNTKISDVATSIGGFALDAQQPGMAEGTSENVARPFGLRGPMVLSGWGFDVDGMPVPNARFEAALKDADPESPTYGLPMGLGGAEKFLPAGGAASQAHKHFLPYYMSRPDQWKAGPIDLRWDRDRKVWVGGLFNQIYLSKATRCIMPETGIDGGNSFNFGVGGNINSPGRLYRNPCPTTECPYTMYFPKSQFYPDIEIFDPEDHNWCGRCRTYGHLTGCSDFKDGCQPFYHALVLRSVLHQMGAKNAPSNCTDKFRKAQGGGPGARRAGNPCHGWGDSYFGKNEYLAEKIKAGEMNERARSVLYQKIFVENPLGQGLMAGDAFFSYDTGRRITYEYTKTDSPTCGQKTGKPITVKETIPVHIILQAEFYGMEIISHAGCERGEMSACTRKFFAQGFATADDCGPDDDYPQTAAF